jgi:hypothetical protein
LNRDDPVLIDTNAIIEAVRTGCWAAITGQTRIETVEVCRQEALATPAGTVSGYVPVTEEDLQRLSSVHFVDEIDRAALKVTYPDADGLDAGEHDLLAHALRLSEAAWILCSPDKACIRAAVVLGFGDRICSLQELTLAVGTRPRLPLREHFSTEWLVSFRTKVRMERL